MRRRQILGRLMLAGLASLAPSLATAQLSDALGARASRTRRPGVDDSMRRTVSLVLRAEARGGALPAFMTDPEPLAAPLLDALVPGARLPEDFPLIPAPEAVNRRLPHARSNSVWAVAGDWMVEVDPVRLTVLAIAPEVLPPMIEAP